jgi:hypothetical protein
VLRQLCCRNARSLAITTAVSSDDRFRHHLQNWKWRGRDGNDPSVDIAKDADRRFLKSCGRSKKRRQQAWRQG